MCVFQLCVPQWVLRCWFRSPAVAQSLAWLTGALKQLPPLLRSSELHPAPPSLNTTLRDPLLSQPTSGAASQWAAGLSSATRTRSLHFCTPGTRNTSWSRWTGGAREPSTTSTCSSEQERQTAFGMETSSRRRQRSLNVVAQAGENDEEKIGQHPKPLNALPLIPLFMD